MKNQNISQIQWPALPLSAWADTYATIHMWAQIVGKYKLKLMPYLNHWWQTALYVSPCGLTTGLVPFDRSTSGESFELEFDFIDHQLKLRTSKGDFHALGLESGKSVAAFYYELKELMQSVGVHVDIDLMPKEIPNPIAFDQDEQHHTYDPDSATRHWRLLLRIDKVFKKFRGGFIGKASPVHFFWGSFDLTTSRFSGRRAPPRPHADHLTQEGYSHEVMSVGFWPGSGNIQGPAFYAYASPEPAGFDRVSLEPPQAFYNAPTKGFILLYDDVRKAEDGENMILNFCESAYEAAAVLGQWDRLNLERPHWLQQRRQEQQPRKAG